MTIRVLVADDQEMIRTGLAMILDAQPDIQVIGEAADGRKAVALARTLRPDVCLLDIRMPELDGIEATRQLAGPGVDDPLAVVVIATFDSDEYVHGALKARARGFLLKDAGPALLTQAIHAAANGDALIAPSITARLLAVFADCHVGLPPAQPIEPLTSREEEVLTRVAQGRTNSEIADDLYISISTAKTHLASLMRKLGARVRVEIAMWRTRQGVSRPDRRRSKRHRSPVAHGHPEDLPVAVGAHPGGHQHHPRDHRPLTRSGGWMRGGQLCVSRSRRTMESSTRSPPLSLRALLRPQVRSGRQPGCTGGREQRHTYRCRSRRWDHESY